MSQKRVAKNGKFVFKGFHNLTFTQTEIDQIILLQDADDRGVDDCIVTLTEAGYKVSFSFDDYAGTLTGALTCKEPGSCYFGYVFTLRNTSSTRLCFAFRWLYDAYLKEELFEVQTSVKAYDW